MAKWAVELSEYDIEYLGRTCMKSQVLADFIVELPQHFTSPTSNEENWYLYVDGATSQHGSGIRIRLTSPTREVVEQSFRLNFTATNNESEYKALLAGMRLAAGIGVKRLHAYCDSQLVANQYNGEYGTKCGRMDAYLKIVKELAQEFDHFMIDKIPRSANAPADALAILASTSDPDLRRVIPVESIFVSSIDAGAQVNVISTDPMEHADMDDETRPNHDAEPAVEPADWRQEILQYINDGVVPTGKWQSRRLKKKAAQYAIVEGRLYRWSAAGILLHCISAKEAQRVMQETHEGAGGNHSGGHALALKIRKHGIYWPTMVSDCEQFAVKCEKCQRHASDIHAPAELLSTTTAPYPFIRWAMDIIGPLPASHGKKFLLILTDYFTKWVEADSYKKIQANEVQNFVWENIICHTDCLTRS
ncbi:PREDICTED: uncharacterized protein LOC104759498 [Camelina sativa]|uniref:Uncharacterized protein LOC104759498 n=1 Tax=Camelina sativa TaxID=90675 RepID=A0ABM0X4V2_CAMSA|nr:PREDICTED: uncharacterized protein LOC104759498 [Camelina sativa]